MYCCIFSKLILHKFLSFWMALLGNMNVKPKDENRVVFCLILFDPPSPHDMTKVVLIKACAILTS